MYGVLDETWNGIYAGTWKIDALQSMMTGKPLEYSYEDKIDEGMTSHENQGAQDLFDENSIHAVSSIYGFLSFCQVALASSMWALTASGLIDFTTLWGAGASTTFLYTMIINAPEVILWPLSFIHNDLLGVMFLMWCEVNKWGATTAYWIGPLLMMVA